MYYKNKENQPYYALGDYIINFSDDTQKAPIHLPVKRINTVNTSLRLTGRGSKNWGESLQENLLHLMEHFASATAPANPTSGQLWFNTNERRYYFYDVNIVTGKQIGRAHV